MSTQEITVRFGGQSMLIQTGSNGAAQTAASAAQDAAEDAQESAEQAASLVERSSIDSSYWIGASETPVTGSALGDITWLHGDPVAQDCTVDQVRLFSLGSGNVKLSIWTRSGDTYTRKSFQTVAVTPGVNVIENPGLVPLAGEYLGWYAGALISYAAPPADGVGWIGGISGDEASITETPELSTVRPQIGFRLDIAAWRPQVDEAYVPAILADGGWNHFLTYGQSYSNGITAGSAISTTPSAYHRTFGVGPKMTKPGITLGVNADDGTDKALVEDTEDAADTLGAAAAGETACYRFAAEFSRRSQSRVQPVWFCSAAGLGSATYRIIAPASDWYENFTFHVAQAKDRADAAGVGYSVPFVAMMHGETDQGGSVPKAAYRAFLDGFVANAQRDIMAITGQTVPPVFLFTHPNLNAATSMGATDAIMELCAARSDCHFVLPTYRLPQSSSHPPAKGHALMGTYLARAASEIAEGRVPGRVEWLRATYSTTTVTVWLRAPTAIALNTTDYGSTTDSGIKVIDDTGTLTLSAMTVGTAVLDPRTGLYDTPITMTIHRAFGANPRLRYARDYTGSGDASTGSRGGNVFDTNTESVTIDGTTYALKNAAPAVELTVYKVE